MWRSWGPTGDPARASRTNSLVIDIKKRRLVDGNTRRGRVVRPPDL
jgi:hypothetical protein